MLREEFDDWAVLFDPDTGRGFGLNPTGVYLWKLLDGEHDLDALLEKVRQHADDVCDDAGNHIKVFIDILAAEGLAGFDRTMFGLGSDVQRCSSPSGSLTDAPSFVYESPKLVDLGGGQKALGVCSSHGSYGGDCKSGTGATLCCYATGSCPTTSVLGCCNAGGCAAAQASGCCAPGTCPSTTDQGYCYCGTCASYPDCCFGFADGYGCTSGGIRGG